MADARTWSSIRTKFQAAAYANARLLPDKSRRRLVVLYRFTILEPLKKMAFCDSRLELLEPTTQKKFSTEDIWALLM